jgi:hypothetical protein
MEETLEPTGGDKGDKGELIQERPLVIAKNGAPV